MAFAQQKPNIVIIISDDQSYQNTGTYDSKLGHTSNIDRIPFGIRFNKTYVTNSISDPRGPMLLMGNIIIEWI
ncbi:sulfatase-like hydrolase/transferase [Sphingobacterium sp. KU25419]|nr:sulfatase-like hydrolase/transferase [Sphingobacterium sp. KU25419]